MQVLAGYIASRALDAKNRILCNTLAGLNINRPHMRVKRDVAVRVLNINTVAITAAGGYPLHMASIQRINQAVAAIISG